MSAVHTHVLVWPSQEVAASFPPSLLPVRSADPRGTQNAPGLLGGRRGGLAGCTGALPGLSPGAGSACGVPRPHRVNQTDCWKPGRRRREFSQIFLNYLPQRKWEHEPSETQPRARTGPPASRAAGRGVPEAHTPPLTLGLPAPPGSCWRRRLGERVWVVPRPTADRM